MKEPSPPDAPADERWGEVAPILSDALERPPAERATFLDAACAGDAELRREVEAYLDADADAPDLLDGRATDFLTPQGKVAVFLEANADSLDDSFDDLLGQASGERRVGPYRLTGRIGRGGMSTVYRGERDDGQFERVVAVKVLRRAVGPGSDMHRRFEAERQILASLSHPHVAQVFDSGVLEEGRPFLVMEYVEGRHITVHCDAEKLPLRSRLLLFSRVAGAVQHAHQNMVVHRDLKPSNILVVPDEASGGTPKLLDFGIAKLLDEAAGGVRTRTGAFLMTPAYAAPEQVRNGDVTAATDVYALGVLLYELLAGRLPYQVEERDPLEIARVVCEEVPPRPSTAVRQRSEASGGEPEDEDAAWQPAPADLRGDLDAIVMKALRKEPAERYPSVEALREDLERHLEGRPVQARRGTWRYRAGKFVRRNRWGVGASAVAALVLACFVTALVWQQAQTARQRDRARAEAVTAEAAVTFLADLFEENNPLTDADGSGTGDSELQAVFARGASRVRTELSDRPVVQARLMSIIGGVYDDQGRYAEGESLLRTAVRQQRTHLGEAHPELAASLHRLGHLLYNEGSFEEAVMHLTEATAIYRALGPANGERNGSSPDAPDHVREHSEVLNTLAQVRVDQGRVVEAERLYRRVIEMRRAAGIEDLASVFLNLAIALRAQDRFEDAIAFHEKSIARYVQKHGPRHPEVANAKAMYAFTLQHKGDLAASEALHWEALAMRRELLPPRHPHIASSLVRMAMVLTKRGRPAEGEVLAQEGYEILREKLPADHWRTVAAKGVVAVCWAGQGQFARAEGPLQESLAHFRREFGLHDWRTRQTLDVLTQLYHLTDQTEKEATHRALFEQAQTQP